MAGRELIAKLPFGELARASGAGEENLRTQGRFARVVFFPHGGGCAACAEYVEALSGAARALGEWDARAVVVVPAEEAAGARRLQTRAAGATVLVDAPGEDAVRARAGVASESAAVLVADRFGDVWYGGDAGLTHALPDVPELEAWLKFLATQCPE